MNRNGARFLEGFVQATKWPTEYLLAPELKHTSNNRKHPGPLAENQTASPGLYFTSNATAECSRNICNRYWPLPKSQMVESQNAGRPGGSREHHPP